MKRLTKNVISLISADVAKRLLGFFAVAYLARTLGVEGFGMINLGLAVLAYSMVFCYAGFPMYGTKQIAQGASTDIVNKIIGGRFITTIIVLTTVTLISFLLITDSTVKWLIILFSLALIPQMFFVDWYFQGKERMEVVSIARVLSAAVYLTIILLFVSHPDRIYYVAIGAFLGDLTAALFLFITFIKWNPSFRFHPVPSLNLLTHSFPLSIGVILATISINIPILLLGILSSATEIGIYSASAKLVLFLLLGDRIISSILLPASARKLNTSVNELKKLLQDALRWVLILTLPVAIIGTVFAKELVSLVFGQNYLDSSNVLRVFIWYFLITMLHTVYTTAIVSIGKDKSYAKTMLLTTFAYIGFVTLGIWHFGAIGAAAGVVISEGISVILLNIYLKKNVKLESLPKIIPILLATIIMGLFAAWIQTYNWIAAGLASFLIYLLTLFILKAVTISDCKILLSKFR